MKKTEVSLLILFSLFLFFVNGLVIKTVYTSAWSIFNAIAPGQGTSRFPVLVFSIILASLVFFTSIVIILERRDPSKTLAWLLILIFLPVLGFILYLVLGRQFRKRRMTAKKKVLNNYIYPLDDSYAQSCPDISRITRTKENLVRLIMNNAEFPITLHNNVQTFTDGNQVFPAMIEAIENARRHVHLETYILRNDELGTQISRLLMDKAKSGVEVRIIYDGLGSRELEKAYLDKMKAAGVKMEAFFPVRLPFLHSTINYRNHRKILVVDGQVGFVGGLNIGDEYLGKDPQIGYWRDTHLQIKGNAVYFLQRIFLQDWYFLTKESLEGAFEQLFPIKEQQGQEIVQITASGPDTHWEAIMQVYYYAIATACKSILLASPYFVPNESILTALKTAALSGVDVKILLPAKSDHRVVFLAAMSYLEELMDAGAEVYLYDRGFLHAKTLAVDGIVATVGSANMDQRSFKLNFEVNALIYSEKITRQLEQDFYEDLQYAQQLDPETFKERPFSRRMLESACRLLSPLL